MGLAGGRLALAVGPQALPHQQHVVQTGNNGEQESSPQESKPGNRDPSHGIHQQQHDKKHRRHLGEGIGLAKNAGAKITQPGRNIEHGAHRHNADVPRENQHRKLPWDLV